MTKTVVIKSNKTTLMASTLAATLTTTTPLIAGDLDFNIGEDSVRVMYSSPIGSADYGRKDVTIGALFNKDDNFFIDTGLHIIDEAGNKFPGLEIGIGPKAYLGQTDTEEYLTVGFEALGNYRLLNMNRVIFSGYGYFAPSIVSFIDADEMWELNFRVAYELIPSANAYIGYRKIRVKVNVKNERTVDNEFHFGIKMEF